MRSYLAHCRCEHTDYVYLNRDYHCKKCTVVSEKHLHKPLLLYFPQLPIGVLRVDCNNKPQTQKGPHVNTLINSDWQDGTFNYNLKYACQNSKRMNSSHHMWLDHILIQIQCTMHMNMITRSAWHASDDTENEQGSLRVHQENPKKSYQTQSTYFMHNPTKLVKLLIFDLANLLASAIRRVSKSRLTVCMCYDTGKIYI